MDLKLEDGLQSQSMRMKTCNPNMGRLTPKHDWKGNRLRELGQKVKNMRER